MLNERNCCMKEFILKNFINAGLDDNLPDYLKRRVKTINIVTLLLIFAAALPFVIFSQIYYPPLTFIPFAGIITGFGVILANKLGGILYSRFFISVLPVWEVTTYNAYLCGPDDGAIGGLFLIGMGFILVPFLMIDAKEKYFLTVTSIICSSPLVGFTLLKRWLNIGTEHIDIANIYIELLRTGWVSDLTYLLGVIIAFGTLIGLAFLNRQSEKKSESLIENMNNQNKVLQNSQKQLEENLQKVEKAQDEEKRRNWATQGIANISEILRSNKNSEEIFDQVVSMVVNYTKSNQGGLFIVDKNDTEAESKAKIRLQSCYAYSRKKYLEQEYEEGQGLIGQAYLEGEHIHMIQIPQNYVNITSGLGEATPSSLLIMPLKVNDMIEGIIEIAAFKKYEDYQIEFIQKLGENVASYIQSNRINERTNKLLREAQEQSEELRAQEEEMRQNMEELAATQEELSRKENEYQKVIANLKSEVKRLNSETTAKAPITG